MDLAELLKKSEAFMEAKDRYYFSPDNRTSGYTFDLDKLHIKEDLATMMLYLRSDPQTHGSAGAPAKPASDKDTDVF
jgi:hypothetical protein